MIQKHPAVGQIRPSRFSATREYIGAVTSIDDLKAGRGECESEAEFYKHRRAFYFNTGRAVQKQLGRFDAVFEGRPLLRTS